MQSDVIRGDPRQSEAIRSHPRSSEAIGGSEASCAGWHLHAGGAAFPAIRFIISVVRAHALNA